ncbi:hypothetical protein MMC14_004783 [Varicellaria rhodocarpa]|nr:hypothetical protein [Varicellaria rhodocarpa]
MHSHMLGDTSGQEALSVEGNLSSTDELSLDLERSKEKKISATSNRRTTHTDLKSTRKKRSQDNDFDQMDSVTRPSSKRAKSNQPNKPKSSTSASRSKRQSRSRSIGKGFLGKATTDLTGQIISQAQTSSRASRNSSASPLKADASIESIEGNGQSTFEYTNLFAEPIHKDWHKLNALDRRVYRLQHGCPLKGNAITLKWGTVIQTLIREKYFSRDQCASWGGEKALKNRYESVRKAVQVFFGGEDYEEEPSSRKNWTIRSMESWDVFDLGPSSTRKNSKSATKDHGVSQALDDEYSKNGPEFRGVDGDWKNDDALNSLSTHLYRDDISQTIGEPLMTEEEVEKVYEDHLSQEQVALSDSHTDEEVEKAYEEFISHDYHTEVKPQVTAQPIAKPTASSTPSSEIHEFLETSIAAHELSTRSSLSVVVPKRTQVSEEYTDFEEARNQLISQFSARDHASQMSKKAGSISTGYRLLQNPQTPEPCSSSMATTSPTASLIAPIVPKMSGHVQATVEKVAARVSSFVSEFAASGVDGSDDTLV